MKRSRASGLGLVFRLLQAFLSITPRPLCLWMGRALGWLVFMFDKKHRTLALNNLRIAFGEDLSDPSQRQTARQVFLHFGELILDIIKISTMDTGKIQRLMTIRGEDILKEAAAGGKGALLFSAHFGNWEIAPFRVSPIAPLHVVARPLDSPFFEEELWKFRSRLGAGIIDKNHAVKSVLKALRANEFVAILIDQNVLRSEAVFVEFFGRPTATTPGLATFHLRTGAPIIPVFCSREPDKSYRVEVLPPVPTEPSGDSNQDVLKITGLCSKIIESQIRKNPGQWLWIHNRWKTQPAEQQD